MSRELKIQEFDDKQVRIVWDDEEQKYYFSVTDVVQVLTEQPNARGASTYWAVLKKRLKQEGASELLTNCKQLKLPATDGKNRATDVADIEQLLRIIQSIPSKKAEPLKRWLAQVGSARIDQLQDPELSIEQAIHDYRRLGYGENWINQRVKSIETRKELTDEWKRSGMQEGRDFAILTDIITKAWSGKTTGEYKKFKGLKKENLRDNMTNLELALNTLAEAATTEFSKQYNPKGVEANRKVAKKGGDAARAARENIENGLFVYGYPYCINIFENVFKRNCKNGILTDLDPLYKNNINNNTNNINNNNFINLNIKKRNQDFNTLLSEFKSCPNKTSNELADMIITNSVIENNMKTGIVLSSCLIYCDGSFITNNLDYAISIKKKEYQYCFKSGKKNVISGAIGGVWGQIEMGKEGCGFFCLGSEKMDLRKKEDILNKVPKSLDESSFEEDYGGKHYSYDLNKGKKNQLDKSRPGNKSDNLDKSLAQSEKNKSIIKNIKNNQDDKDCCIF